MVSCQVRLETASYFSFIQCRNIVDGIFLSTVRFGTSHLQVSPPFLRVIRDELFEASLNSIFSNCDRHGQNFYQIDVSMLHVMNIISGLLGYP